jgi:hypothetical protein
MLRYSNFNIFLQAFVFVFSPIFSLAQISEREAEKLFEKQQYEKVSSFYAQQYELFPQNNRLAYYHGSCRTQTGQLGQQTLDILLFASNGEVPSDVYFYIGKNHHALSDYDNALKQYVLFASKTSKKEQKKRELSKLEDMARKGKNPFEGMVEQSEPEPILSDAPIIEMPVPEPLAIPAQLDSQLIEFRLSPNISYRHLSQFRINPARDAYIKAWNSQKHLDSLIILTNHLRNQYGQLIQSSEKEAIANQIVQSEQEMMDLQPLIGEFLLMSQEKELEYWHNVHQEQLLSLKQENDSIVTAWEKKQEAIQRAEESALCALQEEKAAKDSLVVDTMQIIQAPELTLPSTLENVVVYKVQIGTYRGKLPANVDKTFKRLSILRKIDKNSNEKGDEVYTVGELAQFSDAVKLQQQIRLEGVKDAFVVAYHNGKRITLEEAKKMSVQ